MIGAAKVITAAGPVWCHYSESANRIVLRRYVDGMIIQLEAGEHDIETIVPLAACKNLVHAASYSYGNVAVWTAILQNLEAGIGVRENVHDLAKTPITVPITEFRHFYDCMKFVDEPTHRNLANFYCDTPASLERLWNISRDNFASYDNPDGWGQGERIDLPVSPELLSDVGDTEQFVSFVKRVPIPGLVFVEREINPWRTRGGMFPNGLPATKSGRGGIDVLFQNSENGLPVISEIKVRTDKNAYFALIQAMTYAVEMSTDHQARRLKKHFAQHFSEIDPNHPRVEIALIMVNPDDDPTRGVVRRLIGRLNQNAKCAGLGRVMMFENAGEKWKRHE